MRSTEELLALMPPPPVRWRPTSADWDAAERAGIAWSEDHRALVDEYGLGLAGGLLVLHCPGAPIPQYDLVEAGAVTLAALDVHRTGGPMRILEMIAPELVPFPLYPEPGGLFPIASTIDGDVLYARIDSGRPIGDLVLSESRLEHWMSFQRTLTELLVDLVTGKTAVPFLDPAFPGAIPVQFTAFR